MVRVRVQGSKKIQQRGISSITLGDYFFISGISLAVES
jgi:hypothetical protein